MATGCAIFPESHEHPFLAFGLAEECRFPHCEDQTVSARQYELPARAVVLVIDHVKVRRFNQGSAPLAVASVTSDASGTRGILLVLSSGDAGYAALSRHPW